MENLPTSDVEREKLRQRLLTLMDFSGLDFNRPLIMLSRDALLSGKMAFPPKIPPAMLAKVGWPPQTWIGSPDDFDPMPVVMYPDERERFDRGEPILVRPNPVGLRPKPSSGGQATDDIERHINDAFAVFVFVTFERLRHLVPLRDGKNVRNWADQEAAQDFIFERELLPLPWPEHDHRTTYKRRRDLLDTAWRNGQRPKLLRRFYPSRQLRKEIAIWAERFRDKRRQEIEQEIRFLKTQFVSLNLCRGRAREFRRTEAAISKFMQQHRDDDTYPNQALMEVAAGFNLRVDLGDVAPAAYAGDFDPRPIFLRLASLRSFEFFRQLGKAARGNVPEFSPGTFVERIAESRHVLNEQPELLAERRHPELMSGREFQLYAYVAYERQRAAIDQRG
jgi:hypothetical protein